MAEREKTYWWHLGRLEIIQTYLKQLRKNNKSSKLKILNVGCGTGGTIDMLEKVVELGPIGKTARISGYRIAGKTGTAQIAEGRGYGRLHAVSFVGMAPADDPQYVVAVTAYKSRTISNSLGATPGFVAIMKQVLKTYKLPPATTKSKKLAVRW